MNLRRPATLAVTLAALLAATLPASAEDNLYNPDPNKCAYLECKVGGNPATATTTANGPRAVVKKDPATGNYMFKLEVKADEHAGHVATITSITLQCDEDSKLIEDVPAPIGGFPTKSYIVPNDGYVVIHGNKIFSETSPARLKWSIWIQTESSTNTYPAENGNKPCIIRLVLDPGDCASCSGPCANTASNGSFTYDMQIGRSDAGDTTGTLRFQTKDSTNPGIAGISAFVAPGVTVNRDTVTGLLTSVVSPTYTIELATSTIDGDPNAITITHKHSSTSPRFRTTTIHNVTDGSVTWLRADSTLYAADGVIKLSTTRNQQKKVGDTYTLQTGPVTPDGDFTILREEDLTITPDIAHGTETHREIVRENDVPVSDIETIWTNFAWGWEKTKEVIDPDGATPLTSTWSFYGLGESTTEADRKVKEYLRYDGYREFHTYAFNTHTTILPFAGAQQGLTLTRQWTRADEKDTLTTTRKIGATTLSSQSECYEPNANTNTVTTDTGVDTLTTTTTLMPFGQDFGGQPASISHPDGTLTTYEYTRHTGGGKTVVRTTGAASNGSVTLGKRTTTTHNRSGTIIRSITETVGYSPNITLDHYAVTSVDDFGRPLTTAYFPGLSSAGNGEVHASITGTAAWTTYTSYSCCGVESTTDRHGVSTTYAYDGLRRQIGSTTLGVTTETVHNGLTTTTKRGGLVVAESTRNLAGTYSESWSPNTASAVNGALVATTTATTYANDLITTVTTVPGGSQQTTITYPDGRTYQSTGDLSPNTRYAYDANATSVSYLDGGNLRETTVTTTDWAGRTTNTTKGTESTDYTYNSLGQLESVEDADGVRTLYGYNSRGERIVTALDVNGDGDIDYGGTDQITVTTSVPGTYGGYSVMTTTTEVYATNSSSTATTASTTHQTPDGLHSWTIGAGTTTATSRVATIGDTETQSWTETTAKPDGTYVVSSYAGGLLDQTISYDSEDNEIASTTIGYDGLNRPETSTDSRTGTTTTLYVSATCDAVASVTDPGSRVTSFTYDSRGNRTTVTHPNTTSVTSTSYYPSGQVRATWGSLAYPTFTTYDYAGRQKTLRTKPTLDAGIPTDAGGSLTTWNYSAVNGRLTSKLDNSDKGTSYTYTDAGRPYTRAWARGTLSTTYGYTAGQLTTTNYSDSTPDVTVTYSRFGRPLTITQFQQSKIEYTYTADLAIDTEIVSIDLNHDGDFADSTDLVRTLDRSDDTLKRTTGWQLKDGGTTENQATYTYDSAGRLDTVEDATNTFTYGYQYNQTTANDPRAGSTSGSKQDFMPYTVTKDGSPTLQTLRTYEATRDALSVIQNNAGNDTRSSYTYTVNALGQRTNATLSGAATNSTAWGYDSLGQVLSANASGTNADRYFAYDDIGNRLRSRTGTATDSDGTLTEYFAAPTPSTVAGANALNQYVRIARGGTSFVPGYDDDGNATAYPLPIDPAANSTLVWDAENRLIEVKNSSAVTLVKYAYDALSRRISKIPPTGSATLYIHDGFNCIAEYTGTTLSKTRTWGLDLSGTLQGAGGVGGLLAEKQGDNYFYPTYDGNGNVSEYLDGDGVVQAHYEYDPFGNTVVSSGAKAADFAHRFSTKYLDAETGLYYYGYRYYDPLTGRWPSRDPIEEKGGINLYGFVNNDGVDLIDPLGQDFIAVGSSYMLGGWWTPGAGHLMLTYWEESKRCIREGDRKDQNSNVSSTNWKTSRQLDPYNFVGPIMVPVSNNARLTKVVQLGFDFRSHWVTRYTQIVGIFSWREEDRPHISHINESSNDSDADMYRVIYADSDETRDTDCKWSTLMYAASNYLFAEHKPFTEGQLAQNWPNSRYGHLAADGNYNNSNTFAHAMANSIGKAIPISGWGGRSHPGNITPVPVSDFFARPTPRYTHY